MKMFHCQHCYDKGFEEGRQRGYVDGRLSTTPEHIVYDIVELTDELRALYGIEAEMRFATVIRQGDKIITLWSPTQERL